MNWPWSAAQTIKTHLFLIKEHGVTKKIFPHGDLTRFLWHRSAFLFPVEVSTSFWFESLATLCFNRISYDSNFFLLSWAKSPARSSCQSHFEWTWPSFVANTKWPKFLIISQCKKSERNRKIQVVRNSENVSYFWPLLLSAVFYYYPSANLVTFWPLPP